ncbi:hypothetical protein BGY98DRAFT_909472 [Russula aff. rugulosa BPL654]|nr:hypothetical protein BGY98DRAFT_909472 [Russula aff. rugulosa BPL654]
MPAIETYVPSHPGLFEVDFKEEYCSALIARKVFQAGEVIAYLTDITEGPKSYPTLQLMWSKVRQPRLDRLRFVVCYARPRNTVRLTRAALRLINHSCDPNAAFNLIMIQIKRNGTCTLLSVLRPESVFYPNTEWLMDRPFNCICGATVSYHAVRITPNIEGAAFLTEEELLTRGTVSLQMPCE